jgi:hypothetical protein
MFDDFSPEAVPVLSDKEKVEKAVKSRDPGDVKDIDDYKAAINPDRRFELIDILANQGWVGIRDEWALESLWGTYGDGVVEAAKSRPDLWKKSIEGGADLDKLPAVKAIPPKFIEDVRGLAYRYLDENEKYCNSELVKVGAAEPDPGQPKPDVEGEMAQLQQAAKVVQDAQKGQQDLLTIRVGMRQTVFMGPDGKPLQGWADIMFVPNSPPTPQQANPTTATPPGPDLPRDMFQPFDAVQAEYDNLQAIIDGVGTMYPAVYAVLMQSGPSGLATVAGDNPAEAKSMVTNAVKTVLENIKKSRPLVAGSLPYDLEPIQMQLLSGSSRGGSGINWGDPVPKALAEQVLKGHKSKEFWVTMGLATLAMAAFIIAEFLTAGLATFALVGFGVGLGVGMAGMSWDKAYDLATAKKAAMTKQSEMVSQGQVDMATIEAILNTVLVAVDVLMAAKTAGRALAAGIEKGGFLAGEGAARTALSGLEKLASLSANEAKSVVEKAVTELGIDSVTKRTGKSVSELLAIVGEQSSVASRLKAYMALPEELAKMSATEFAQRSAKLSAEVTADRKLGEAMASLAVERFGPAEVVRRNGGWKALSLALGNESPAGKVIMSWRDGIVGDIEAFVSKLPGGLDETGQAAVKRTGSQGKFTNDFDISLLGPNSSANRNAVRSFVAGRLGTTPSELGELILADFFTDPNRLHLYDQLSPALRAELATRAEKIAESTIFAKTLADAEKAGNKELAEQLRAQMKALGIQEAAFKPLAAADRSALYTKIDDLHGQLKTAIEANDQVAQKKLVEQIGDTQGLINAAEGGGYFSGGGTKAMVSLPEKLAKGAQDLLPQQKYTALLDQLPKLYGECNSLLRAGVVASEESVSAIKGIAKYADRFSKLAKDMGVAGPEVARFEELSSKFTKILKAAKGETDPILITRLADDAAAAQLELGYLLDAFQGASREMLLRLSRQAGLSGAPVDLAKIQFLTMATAKLSRASEAVRASVTSLVGRLVQSAENAKNATSGTPPPPATK